MPFSAMGKAVLLMPLALVISGCASFKEARMYGECTNKMGGGGECKVGAEVKWERPPPPKSSNKLFASLVQSPEVLPDAAQYVINVDGSTIPYPSSGTMTVRLVNSSTGMTVASRVFDWVRNGNLIQAKYPDSINEWAYSYGESADSVTYELTKFFSPYGGGLQRISGASSYEGSTIASYSSQFYGGPTCTTYPSPHLCQGN